MGAVDRVSGVYGIVHRETGRAYVGSSRHVFKRWDDHIYLLSHGRHTSPQLQALWTDREAEDFSFFVLEQCAIEDLVAREQAWLDSFENPLNASSIVKAVSLDPKVSAKIAASLRGKPLTAERRRKISEARTGQPMSEKTREHLQRLHALTRSDERRFQFRDAVRNNPNIRARQQANHWARSERASEVIQQINATKSEKRALKKEGA